MNYYKVSVAFIELSGRLRLTDAQAAARKHALEPVKGDPNVFATKAPVGFKRGEILGIEGELDRGQRSAFEALAEFDFERHVQTGRAAAAQAREKQLAARNRAAPAKPAAKPQNGQLGRR